jgi:hypothetical protein
MKVFLCSKYGTFYPAPLIIDVNVRELISQITDTLPVTQPEINSCLLHIPSKSKGQTLRNGFTLIEKRYRCNFEGLIF